MSRTHLLGAVSAAALTCLSSGAFAHSAITGGGSTLAEFDYFVEFADFNNAQSRSQAIFFNPSPAQGNNVYYWPAGSGSGQAAFLNDDLTCDSNKVLGLNNKLCSNQPPGNANYVSYGASDATLNSTQESQWASSQYGQSAAGNLIQLPSMGVGVSFPIQNASITGNNQVALTDDDLCGIFSGKITDWSQTSASASLTPGAITVVYRSDGSGTSFLLLNHFAAVCNKANSAFTLPIVPTTTFAAAFPGSVVPSNFVGASGSQGVAVALTGDSSATGYLTPDLTTIDPNSNATLDGTNKSNLVVADVYNGNTAYTPTVANITSALLHPSQGTHLTPPKNAAAGANPDNYVPLIQTTTTGYPVVGYTTFDLAQCYADATIGAALIKFLKTREKNTTYTTTIKNNGFVTLSKTGASTFVAVINGGILGNTKGWNDNIDNASACSGLVGR